MGKQKWETGFNRKKWEKWEMEKWESVTKMKKPKTLRDIDIIIIWRRLRRCQKNIT